MGEPKLTRRTLLSIIAGIFYPLGLAAPLVVKAKIALKRIVVRGLAWDEEIQKEDDQWSRRWLLATERLNEIALPRCLFPSEHTVKRTELHTFSDASEEAFATVTFIRNVHEDGTVVTRFVMAKTKVAPSNHLSGKVGTAGGIAGSPSGQLCSRNSNQTGPSAIFPDGQL